MRDDFVFVKPVSCVILTKLFWARRLVRRLIMHERSAVSGC